MEVGAGKLTWRCSFWSVISAAAISLARLCSCLPETRTRPGQEWRATPHRAFGRWTAEILTAASAVRTATQKMDRRISTALAPNRFKDFWRD